MKYFNHYTFTKQVKTLLPMLGALLITVACQIDNLPTNNNTTSNEQTTENSNDTTRKDAELVPLSLSFEANIDIPSTPAAYALKDEATYGNGTRAIDATIGTNGKLNFDFDDTKEDTDMLVILRKKNTNQCIYLNHLKYKGLGNKRFKITKQQVQAWATNNAQLKANDNDWYAMYICGQAADQVCQNGKQRMEITGTNAGHKSPIVFIASNLTGSNVDKYKKVRDTKIPFVSDWTPVTIFADQKGDMCINAQSTKLYMQGVLMRIEVTNDTSFPLWMKNIAMETNVLHPNINYQLSPEKLPQIGGEQVHTMLKWDILETKPMALEKKKRKDVDLYTICEKRQMMGQSFVMYRCFEKEYKENANLVTMPNRGNKLNTYLYVWGMPLTIEEKDKLDNVNTIPMTAIYTIADLANNNTYTLSNADDFDQQILKGKKPAPAMAASLSFVSGNTLHKDGAPLSGKVVPIKVKLENRPPSAVEMMCQRHALRPGADGSVKFSEQNTKTYIDGHNKDSHYLSHPFIDTTDKNKYRIMDENSKKVVQNYHIPNKQEVEMIYPLGKMGFGEMKPSDGIKVAELFKPIEWITEKHVVDRKLQETWAYYRKCSADETSLYTGAAIGEVNPFNLSLRGLRKVSGNNDKFEYSPLLGIYFYSAGRNEFFVEYIPLTKQWVRRFNGDRNQFQLGVMNPTFYEFSKGTTIRRSVGYFNNYGNAKYNTWRPFQDHEAYGGFMWLSGIDKKDMGKGGHTLCWGVQWTDDKGREKGNIIFNPYYDNKWRTTDGTYCGYGVTLFHDKLW